MESAIRPLRLVGNRLLVPGVIGVRNPHSLSFDDLVHVLVGPDAGFPEGQALDEWKRDLALVDASALPAGLRKEAGLQLPAEERAELEAREREFAEFPELGGPLWATERALGELVLDERTRLTPLDERARRVLEAHGHAYWVAGYSRVTSHLWVHRIGGAAPFKAWVGRWDEVREDSADGGPPEWMRRGQYFALWRVRWVDRMLRALSDGAVTEPLLLCVNRHEELYELVEDDILQAGIDAAARISTGADEVVIPLHGPARRVRLPAFTIRVSEADPFDARPGAPWPLRDVEVPAEDAWVLVKDLA